jgi:cob(I)alamin adenosyltransferase
MKPYTRTGDDGTTGRPGGRRVRKSDPGVEANGAVDELNAHVGLCRQMLEATGLGELAADLREIQSELLAAGAAIAGAEAPLPLAPAARRFEAQVDRLAADLPELASFLLPGGCELACRLHVARTVCRRAERAVVAAADSGAGIGPAVLAYLNRLSDLLFVLARWANRAAGVEEERWQH